MPIKFILNPTDLSDQNHSNIIPKHAQKKPTTKSYSWPKTKLYGHNVMGNLTLQTKTIELRMQCYGPFDITTTYLQIVDARLNLATANSIFRQFLQIMHGLTIGYSRTSTSPTNFGEEFTVGSSSYAYIKGPKPLIYTQYKIL